MGDVVGVLANAVTRLKTDFIEAFLAAEATYLDAMLFSTSGNASEKYGWLGQSPQMREWKDERIPAGLSDWDYTILNKRFENSLAVDLPTLERDQTGAIRVRIQDLAGKAREYPHSLLSALRTGGTSGLCYDGQAFFANAHVEGSSGSQDNLLAQTGTTVANVKTDFNLATAAMEGFKDDRGVAPIGAQFVYVVVCGPSMKWIMKEAFEQVILTAGGNNIYAGLAKVEIDRAITGNGWVLENRAGKMRGYILQEEKAVTLTNTDPTSDEAFMRGKVMFGTEWRGNAGYGDWRRCVLVGALT